MPILNKLRNVDERLQSLERMTVSRTVRRRLRRRYQPKIAPSMFDFPMLRETLTEYGRKADGAIKSSHGNGAVEQAIEKLLAEARSWLTKAAA